MASRTPTRTHGPQVARFFERYLTHRKGIHAGEPFQLEPFQRRFLDEFYELDSRGRRLYKYGYLGIPRGNGKSPLAAGLGLYELLVNKDSPDIFNLAAAKDQARVLIDFARGFVEDNEKLGGPNGKGWIEPSVNVLRCHENNGVMRVLSSSGLNLHGLSPTAGLIDELHAFVASSQEEGFNAILTALHKRPDAFMLAITTAGYDKATLLGRAYDEALAFDDGEDELQGCLRIRRDRENGTLFYWYGIPETRAEDWEDEKLWRHANPASWVNIPDLRKQLNAPGFHQLDWQRLHANMWTAVRESWLPSGCWLGLRGSETIPDGAPIYVGVDVGMYHDTTAVAWAYMRDDGRVIVRSHVWAVKPELPQHEFVTGGRMRLALVDDFLRKLAREYRVEEIVFDPTMFAAEADRLHDEGVAPFFELKPGSSAMKEAYQGFYQACRESKIIHDGDKVLTAHVDGTAAEMTERGWQIRKLRSKVNDACVATVIAHYRAVRAGGPSVYDDPSYEMTVLDVERDEWADDDPDGDDDDDGD